MMARKIRAVMPYKSNTWAIHDGQENPRSYALQKQYMGLSILNSIIIPGIAEVSDTIEPNMRNMVPCSIGIS